MADPLTPESQPVNESTESFKDLFSQYEQSRARNPDVRRLPGMSARCSLLQRWGVAFRIVDRGS